MACQPKYSISDVDLLEALAQAEARESFWAFRRLINPRMKTGWFQRDVANHLQQWYADFLEGLRPILIICSPPQHGKSEQVADFIAWLAGKNPAWKTIFASFSDRLGVKTNLRLQRLYDSERYQKIFPGTRIGVNQKLRNTNMLEYDGHDGFFRNTTVQGAITGEGLDLGFLDDPIKGAAEARSQTIREGVWSWMVDDFMSRFSDKAGMIMILTRWHLDDPAGRLLALDPKVKILRYPALAEKGAELLDSDPRAPGTDDPLFPELKTKEFLVHRRSVSTEQSWQALYQQNPIIHHGGLFPSDRFQYMDAPPAPSDIAATVRYWDKAGTAGGGAYTAGVLMHRLNDGRYVVSGVRRGQLAALDREKLIKGTAELDGKGVKIWVEQEPGSGGKESAESTIRSLSGYQVFADKVTGDKETRADPYAAQVQGENVWLVCGKWNRAFVDEHEVFPNGRFKDQVDAAAGAFAKLASTGRVMTAEDFEVVEGLTIPDF